MSSSSHESRLLVSQMTGKLDGIRAINTSPLDNSFCEHNSQREQLICAHCYSRSMLQRHRVNCREPWCRNGDILSSRLLTQDELPLIDTELCRFQAHGELHNAIHAENLYAIARKNPEVAFAFWTKRPELVDILTRPDNVILIYSSPRVGVRSELPRGFDKVFTVFTKEQAESGVDINCGAKSCNDCRLCYERNRVHYINEVIK